MATSSVIIDQDATAPQRRYLRGVCGRVQRQLGRTPWVTKHLFGKQDFSISLAGNKLHELREVLNRAARLGVSKVFHQEGITYAYVQLHIE